MNRVLEEIVLSKDVQLIIKSIAKKFYNAEVKDLYQAGYIGVIKAFNNYSNPEVKFTTFAYKYIFGEMYDFAKNNRNIKVNKNYLKIYKDIEKAKSLLSQKFNREPSLSEISMFLEIDESMINDVIITCKSIMSLDNDREELSDSNLYTIIGSNPHYEENILVKTALEELTDEEKKVISYKYYAGYTQQEIANMLGINQVKVSRIETKGKQKIKEYICA